jgi:ABC-type branched-subunit amino acid transport system substrate-binding protein
MKMHAVSAGIEQPPGCSIIPKKRHRRQVGAGLAALAMAWLVIGCYGSTQPIVKLGLVAPFEESRRDDGYAVLHAVKLAIGQRNAAGGVAGRQVALVAAMQAAKLDVDRDVLGVVGPLAETTAAAASTVLAGDGPAWLVLADTPPSELVPPPGFAAAYRDVAGSGPSPQAMLAFERTNQLLDAIDRAGRSGPLSRETVRNALAELGTAGK